MLYLTTFHDSGETHRPRDAVQECWCIVWEAEKAIWRQKQKLKFLIKITIFDIITQLSLLENAVV